jgi:hypothetical protein
MDQNGAEFLAVQRIFMLLKAALNFLLNIFSC